MITYQRVTRGTQCASGDDACISFGLSGTQRSSFLLNKPCLPKTLEITAETDYKTEK